MMSPRVPLDSYNFQFCFCFVLIPLNPCPACPWHPAQMPSRDPREMAEQEAPGIPLPTWTTRTGRTVQYNHPASLGSVKDLQPPRGRLGGKLLSALGRETATYPSIEGPSRNDACVPGVPAGPRVGKKDHVLQKLGICALTAASGHRGADKEAGGQGCCTCPPLCCSPCPSGWSDFQGNRRASALFPYRCIFLFYLFGEKFKTRTFKNNCIYKGNSEVTVCA